ncbi:MAG: hypothetical protein HYW79_02355 [Parcubacteria group bacterium]|nr:hypothetical protein [Parcubacteria group bacterium]
METFIHKIKYHWATIALAPVLGILMVLPFFYFYMKVGSDFHGVLPTVVNDELFYYARIKDVVDGHPFLSNAYLAEHKEGLPQQLFLAEWLLAQPMKFLNVSVNAARLAYNFLLPAVAFILTYWVLFLISKSRSQSIISSTFLFFGMYSLAFIRPVSPQFNFIFWLSQFIFLWLLITEQKQKWIWFSAVNFGLLFYIYPYYWTFYLIFFCLLAAAYFFADKKLALKILIIAGGGLVSAIPYFYFNYLATQLLYYEETLTRLGLIYSRFPSGARIIFWSLLGFGFFGWFLWKKIINLDIKSLFFISGILASVIAVNQHLITGKNIEFSSHYDMAAMFFLVFTAIYLWSKRRDCRYLSIILLIIASGITVFGLINYSKRVFIIDENAAYRQNYMPIFEWLNKNTEKDSVVYANVDVSGLIPVYTANNVFYIREANLFFISDEEVLNRFILNNFFKDFGRDFVIENDRSVYGVRYVDAYGHAVQGNKLRKILGLKSESEIYLPEEAIQKVITRAKELQKRDFIEELKRFRVDYLIWDKNKNPEWKMNSKNFNPVFSSGDLIIFKFVSLNP